MHCRSEACRQQDRASLRAGRGDHWRDRAPAKAHRSAADHRYRPNQHDPRRTSPERSRCNTTIPARSNGSDHIGRRGPIPAHRNRTFGDPPTHEQPPQFIRRRRAADAAASRGSGSPPMIELSTPDNLSAGISDFTFEGDLTRPATAAARGEQAPLRQRLFGDAKDADCAISR